MFYVFQTNFAGVNGREYCFAGSLIECETYVKRTKAKSFSNPQFEIAEAVKES